MKASRRSVLGFFLAVPVVVPVAVKAISADAKTEFQFQEVSMGYYHVDDLQWDSVMRATLHARQKNLVDNVLANNALLRRVSGKS